MNEELNKKPTSGIAVDGYCDQSTNRGGYKGIDISTGEILFQRNYSYTTNNICEFLAVCHALGYNKKNNSEYGIIFTDSQVAISWLRNQKINSGINMEKGKDVLEDVGKCIRWISEQKRLTPVVKWETKVWGEIPADFGNK